MKELGMTLLATLIIGLFFSFKIYPDLEYSGVGGGHSCTGECYEEYVRVNGTTVEIEQRKREIANADEFSSIRSLWSGCAVVMVKKDKVWEFFQHFLVNHKITLFRD